MGKNHYFMSAERYYLRQELKHFGLQLRDLTDQMLKKLAMELARKFFTIHVEPFIYKQVVRKGIESLFERE